MTRVDLLLGLLFPQSAGEERSEGWGAHETTHPQAAA
jgi:hypothetical protein